MKRVEVIALDGGLRSGLAVTLDILATANRIRVTERRPPPFAVRIWGSAAPSHAGGEFSLATDDAPAPDLMIMPGLGFTTGRELTEGLARADVRAATARIAAASAAGAEIAAACTGVFALAATGLLDNRRATTAWWLARHFTRAFPAVRLEQDAMVITDGPFTTAGAALAQIDLMLALVARHAGAEVADMCSRYMLLDARQSQASYVSLEFVTAGDARLRRARDWVRARMAEDFTIPALASAAGMSPRTFARRLAENTGLSPVRFVQRLRAERAAELLETTRLPVDEVAHQVGYADASTLRRVLRRHLGGRPHALRMAAREARSIQL